MADIAAEGSSKVVLEADATGGIELQSKIEQETVIPSAQETEVDVVSSKDAPTADVAHGVKTEVEAETHVTDAATTMNDLTAVESREKEQPAIPTTEVSIFYSCGNTLTDLVLPRKDDSIKRSNEAAIVAVGLSGLVVAEGFSSLDKAVPDVIHETTPKAGNDSVENRTTHNGEPQQEREVDVITAPETEDAHPDIHLSLCNDSTPVPLPADSESSLIETGLVAERQVETTSATTNGVPINVEDQRDPSLLEPASNAEEDTEEVQTQVVDTSNIKDEPIPESDVAQHIEAADTDGPLEDASTKESQITVQLEPDVDSVLPGEGESSTITQVATEDLLPKVESEDTTSQTPVESIPVPEDTTAPVADVEEQIIAPVDVGSEHASVVAHEVETEVEAETHETDGTTATNEFAASESPETEKPAVPTTEVFIFYSCGNTLADPVLYLKGDSNKHVIETAIVAAGLATAEGFSSVEKIVPEVSHDATPEAANDSVESGTTLKVEPQHEDEDDVTTGLETEDVHPDIHTSLRNDPTPIPLPVEPESSLIETGFVTEHQDETTSSATTDSVPDTQKEIEAPAKHDLTSTAEESAAVFISEPKTSYAFERTPAHHSLVESGKPVDENAVNQSETIELKATEAEHMIPPVEDKLDVVDSKISDSGPIHTATKQLPEVASEEIFQPQSSAVLIAKDVLDSKENQVEDITSSTELEGHGAVENIEAKEDYVVKEVDLTCFS